MRKLIVVFLTLFLFSFSNYASDGLEEVNKNTSLSKYSLNLSDNYSFNSFDTEYDLALINLQVDVLGIVFFGPQISLDFQFANMIAVGPYVRWHYAGVFYQGIVTDWFTDGTTTSLASYSVGAQAKFLFPIGSGQHRPFVGIGFEKSKGSDSWDPGGTFGKRIYEYESNVLHIDLGYRLTTTGSFNLSAGIGIGISKDTKSIGYYEYGDDPIDYYTLETRVLPMVQVILGWQLGR